MDTGHDGGNDGGGGVISEWSSTIGIVAAIVGNILISFALNIQRYAHIRLRRELDNERHELRAGRHSLSRHVRGSSSIDYGTLGDGETEGHGTHGTATDTGGSRNGLGQVQNGSGQSETNAHRSTDGDPEQMLRSFISDRTVTPFEKRTRTLEPKSYLRSPYWWTGLILMIVGETGNFLAYGFAPASIVSPLGVMALVSNCVIAPFMLKEKFRQRDLWGVLVAICGAVTVVLSAKTSEIKIGPGEIWGMITTWEFELYLGLTIALILTLMWVSEKYGRKTILIDVGLVGLFGGYTALSTKGVSSLLSFTLWHVITFPITYALVAILVFSAMMQIRYINRALQRFDSTQVIPTQFVLFTLSVIIGSAVLYRDFESATLEQSLKFVGGCALTFLGVYLITSGREHVGDMQSDAGDEEETIGLLDGDGPGAQAVYSDQNQMVDRQISGQPVAHSPKRRASNRAFVPDEDDLLDEDDRIRTPRAHLSSSPASSMPSISDTSSLIKSRPDSPKALAASPWTSGDYQEDGEGGAAEAAPGTPTRLDTDPPSKVLLRFPSAPGLTETSPSKNPRTPSPPKHDTARSRLRASFGSRKSGSLSRAPLSVRFSPGPLLPPLSGGLSAVVADSLRRGEASSDRRRRSSTNRKRAGKKPRRDAQSPGEGHAEGETEYETDDSLGHAGGHESEDQFGGPLRRPNFLRRLGGATSPSRSNTQEVVPTVASTAREQSDDVHRVRSLSDSWSEGLGRLGGRFWHRGQSDKHGQPSPPNQS